MGGKKAPAYTPGESDAALADWLKYRTEQAKEQYSQFEKPSMTRAEQNAQQMQQTVRPGFVSFLTPQYQQQLAAGTVPATADGVMNPGQFGLGRTTAAPAVAQLQQAPDWQSVGQRYAATQNTANLLGLDQQLRSAANSGAANLGLRGLQRSSLAPTQQAALQNWANVTRAQNAGDTMLKQQAIETALRGESNATATQAQQNEWAQAAWDQAQQQKQTADMWNVMNYLQGGTVPTMQANVNTGEITSGLQGQQQQNIEMWKQQVASAQARDQLWADIIMGAATLGTTGGAWKF